MLDDGRRGLSRVAGADAVLLQLSSGRHWLAVLVMPLLFESRLHELMDATMLLSAPGQAQVRPLHTQHTLNHISIVLNGSQCANVPSICSQYALIMLSLWSHFAFTCFPITSQCVLNVSMCSHYALIVLSRCSHCALTVI